MPKVGYSKNDKERIRQSLIETCLKLISKQGVQHTTIEQIYKETGISRTFFYSFFSTKEELIIEGLYYQQPKIISYLKKLRKECSMDWEHTLRIFLKECCYDKENFVILSVEEQQLIFNRLTLKEYEIFRKKQECLFSAILECLGIKADKESVDLFINLCMMLIVFHKAIPATLPLLIPEAADKTVEVQIEAIINYLKTIKQ